jgi:hypothetical protein
MRWPITRQTIGWHDECRCGSGLRLQECCIDFVRQSRLRMQRGVGTYLTLGMLWPDLPQQATDLPVLLRRFDPLALVNSLARINVYFHDDVFTSGSALELGTLKHFLPPVLYRKVRLWIEAQYVQRVVHRLTLPALLQAALSHSDDAEGSVPIEGNAQQLGELFLVVNHVIEDDYQVELSLASSRAERQRVLCASLYRQGFFSKADDFPSALGRNWHMTMHGLSAVAEAGRHAPFDFRSCFQAAFGLTVQEVFMYGFGVLAHYAQNRLDLFADPTRFVLNRDTFKNVIPPEHLSTSRKIFDYLGLPWDEHVRMAKRHAARSSPNNMYQLFEFYNHPIVILPEGGLIALDVQFIRNRITEGVFWSLFDYLRAHDKDVGVLKEVFGHVTEWYVRELFIDAELPNIRSDIWFDLDGQLESRGCPKPDVVIREGDTLFFLEVTTSALTPSAAASGNWKWIERQLRRIWFGSGEKGDSAKLSQLAAAIQAHRDGHLTIPGVEASRRTRYVPVLVNLRHLPHWPILMDWYRDIMKMGQMEEWFIRDVKFLDLSELEQLALLRGHGELWTDLFEKKRRFDHRDNSMHNFLCYTGRASRLHPLLARANKEACESFQGVFAGLTAE